MLSRDDGVPRGYKQTIFQVEEAYLGQRKPRIRQSKQESNTSFQKFILSCIHECPNATIQMESIKKNK